MSEEERYIKLLASIRIEKARKAGIKQIGPPPAPSAEAPPLKTKA